jgi:hypothetical protein
MDERRDAGEQGSSSDAGGAPPTDADEPASPVDWQDQIGGRTRLAGSSMCVTSIRR